MKWKFYKTAKNKWRWKRIARNGRIIEGATQGYVRKKDCVGNAALAGWTADQVTLWPPKRKRKA